MEINFTLSLPRDAMSVPVVRRVLRSSMQTLGVDAGCVSDIEVALTEACTNALDHAADGDEYEVIVRLDHENCAVDVVDTGAGFDAEAVGRGDADESAEEGRGIQLIRALVDSVHFHSGAQQGTVVHFEKRLEVGEGAPLHQLAGNASVGGVGDLAAAEQALADREAVLAAAPSAP